MGNRLRSQRSRIEHSTPQPSSHPGQVSYCSHTQSTAGPAFPLPGRLRPAPAESRMRQLLGIPQRGERGERVRVEEAPGTCPPAALTWSRWGRRMEGGGERLGRHRRLRAPHFLLEEVGQLQQPQASGIPQPLPEQ